MIVFSASILADVLCVNIIKTLETKFSKCQVPGRSSPILNPGYYLFPPCLLPRFPDYVMTVLLTLNRQMNGITNNRHNSQSDFDFFFYTLFTLNVKLDIV